MINSLVPPFLIKLQIWLIFPMSFLVYFFLFSSIFCLTAWLVCEGFKIDRIIYLLFRRLSGWIAPLDLSVRRFGINFTFSLLKESFSGLKTSCFSNLIWRAFDEEFYVIILFIMFGDWVVCCGIFVGDAFLEEGLSLSLISDILSLDLSWCEQLIFDVFILSPSS